MLANILVVKVVFTLIPAFPPCASFSASFILPYSPLPSHLVGPVVFAQGSGLWNVNIRLCVNPEEPASTRDKTPPTRIEEKGSATRMVVGDLKFNKAAV